MNHTFKLRNMFRSLRYWNFRLFFGGQSISLIGTWIQRIAMPWLVFRLTGSAFWLGAVAFAGQIPTLLMVPFAGVLIDRWNRYHILLVTQVLAAVQALLLALVFYSGTIEVWHIFVLSIFLGLINAFDMPARQAFLLEMVKEKKDLSNAIALNSSMVNGARLIGPSLAGMLIAFTSEGICFLLNAASYSFVILALVLMKTSPEKRAGPQKVMQGLKEGVSYALGFAPIKYIIALLAVVSLFGMPYAILMPVVAKDVLHGGAHTFGFLMGASGIGALVGALYLASRKSVAGLERVVPFSAMLFGAGIIAFSFSRSFLFSLSLMFITGFGMILQLASSNTILQTVVDDDKRGRIMSFYAMAFFGTVPFGSLLAGSLASTIGAPHTLLISGVACVAGAAAFLYKLADLRRIIHPVYAKMGIIPEVAAGLQSATQMTAPPEE